MQEQADLSRVERWSARLNRSDRVLWLLFWASFAETLIVPIPIELVLIPFMIANRDRLWKTAAVVTAGCLCAALLGYGIGFLFFDTLGQQLVAYFGGTEHLERFRSLFDQYGFWAIVAVGVTPVPFQIAMLAAGAAGFPPPLFLLAAGIARGIRYFGLALLVYLFGAQAEALWKRHKALAGLLALAVVLTVTVIAWM